MQGWSGKREVEKPKPLKERATAAATRLINLREAITHIIGPHSTMIHDALSEDIDVLMMAAGERKRSARP